MTERERWIIYPLLFFALGAALRDKFLQHVTTNEIVATKVMCEELVVVDPRKPDRVVARLASGTPEGAPDNAESFGLLVLIDSEGKELCGVTNNALQVNQISAREILGQIISVIDPENPQRRLAILTSTNATGPDQKPRRLGSLLLTDNEGTAIFGLANDQMQMRSISCQGIAIVDPDNGTRVLAALGSAAVKPNPDAPLERLGMLQLNDQRFIGLRGSATEAPFDAPPPPTAPPAEEPADETPAEEAPAGAPAEQDSAHVPSSDRGASPAGSAVRPPAEEAD